MKSLWFIVAVLAGPFVAWHEPTADKLLALAGRGGV